MIRVMLVDDHVLIRKGIRLLLETFQDIEFVGEAGEGDEAIVQAMRLKPDVILMDLSMPNGLDGFSASKEIYQQLDQCKIVLLTMYDEESYVKKAIELGIHGYLLKKSQGSDLYEAIQSVHHNQRFYKTSVPDEKMEKWLEGKDHQKQDSVLTDREKEIVRLTLLGFSNREIAGKLLISVKTVENHKSNIMQKLNISSKHELIQYAINNNYLDLMI
ncbi:response regulator [Hazenella coriacea]|uniref:LuxR family two component transcriptional regulator n=1 Tax=Hazenella coriacea TaxID=1179467 RepID=A0A4R3L4G4_9BACL|nr:response regulator transcription factor [Hazenella coriacea]TCS94192.1 LuxR family two component transcriptional regulator [Hazenella coriacea]